ncbi:hypothetical protein [Geomonas propionica]|uniref:Uncharacterized protein n=1 Tax=Geomonas propionica TaxID=2798582 RepID=A0ABS0YPB0_9BACT|nr:hypothetical protein [Geomonas propionica]MBJ6799750.1 hypothetical protein [Geomonas propionica]
MTRYTDTRGNHILLCDSCRQDMPAGTPAITIAPGRTADGFVSRDYDKGELILCAACASSLGYLMTMLGIKRAESLTATKEAA